MDKQAYLDLIDEVIERGPYKADWNSLCRHEVPKWFRDGKFGIFIHWGVYSVPAYANEWYSRNMYIKGTDEFEYHRKTFGEHKDFGYKDFIPMFKAENFDADKWMDLFEESGARYVIPVAEHHDGFQMYKSEMSHWNAYEMGPKRDVIGELTKAVRKHEMILGASSHRIEHWFFMGHGREFESDITDAEQEGDFYWPAEKEAEHYDLFSEPTPTKAFLDDWFVRVCELIDKYHICELYFDWWIQHNCAKEYLKKIAAYYYNRAEEWGEEVMIAYKHDAFMFGTAVVDVERGKYADAKPFYWQTDTAIAKNSWCYTKNNEFKKAKDIICDLVDIVSKNGCLLLNVGPKADGTITEEETDILKEIGKWLRINGEMIYGSRVWRFASEGPTLTKEGHFTDGDATEYTSQDFRFTVNGEYLYAACMAYPEDGKVTIKSLAKSDPSTVPKFNGIISDVIILGFDEKPEWHTDKNGLVIQGPKITCEQPVVFKMRIR